MTIRDRRRRKKISFTSKNYSEKNKHKQEKKHRNASDSGARGTRPACYSVQATTLKVQEEKIHFHCEPGPYVCKSFLLKQRVEWTEYEKREKSK